MLQQQKESHTTADEEMASSQAEAESTTGSRSIHRVRANSSVIHLNKLLGMFFSSSGGEGCWRGTMVGLDEQSADVVLQLRTVVKFVSFHSAKCNSTTGY